MIYEESYETEDWSNYSEKQLCIPGINYVLKYAQIENSFGFNFNNTLKY